MYPFSRCHTPVNMCATQKQNSLESRKPPWKINQWIMRNMIGPCSWFRTENSAKFRAARSRAKAAFITQQWLRNWWNAHGSFSFSLLSPFAGGISIAMRVQFLSSIIIQNAYVEAARRERRREPVCNTLLLIVQKWSSVFRARSQYD